MGEATGTAPTPKLSKERVAELDEALAQSAGVPTVVKAVEDSTRLRANRATGWPVVAWFSRLRPDPLKRLHLDLGSAGKELSGRARTSVPSPTTVQRALVDSAVRDAGRRRVQATCRSRGARPCAKRLCRDTTTSTMGSTGRSAATELGTARIPAWAGFVRVLQWLLLLAALGGAAWLGAMFGPVT